MYFLQWWVGEGAGGTEEKGRKAKPDESWVRGQVEQKREKGEKQNLMRVIQAIILLL